MKNNQVRDSNFEFMRIVSMILIILWHVLSHGGAISHTTIPTLKYFLTFLMYVAIVHVDSFVILFGHFQSKSKFKLKKLIKLFLQVMFYSIVILVVCIKLKWVDLSKVVILENILPSSLSNYWFIYVYIFIYIFSDYLNKIINRLTRKEYKGLLILGFVMLSIVPYITGFKLMDKNYYDYINFIYLYLIGGYLSRYPLKESYHFKRFSKNGYRLLLISIFFTMALSNFLVVNFCFQINSIGQLANYISNRILISNYHLATPFVIIQTICYFELFKTINFKSKIINFISGCTFGIYLFHDNKYIRPHIYKILKIDNGLISSYRILYKIIIVVFIIFVIGLIIEIIRQIIFKLIRKIPIVNYLINKFSNFVNSFNTNLNL